MPSWTSASLAGIRLLFCCVLFLGGSNPLSYSRAASFAARSAQAIISPSPQSPLPPELAVGRMQLYVDDPALTVAGNTSQRHLSLDVVLAWWLVLGIPLAWAKGSLTYGRQQHEWIGVSFCCLSPGTCTMTVPEKFRADLLVLAQKFARTQRKTASLAEAHALCGRAGRLAQVVPEARPFTAALFAALAASLQSHASRSREAPPAKVAVRRYRVAATWLCAVLRGDGFKLQHTFHLHRELLGIHAFSVEFDASPWGGGSVLVVNGKPTEFFSVKWSNNDASHLGVETGKSKWQSFWELAMLTLCICRYSAFRDGVTYLGDNIASLELAPLR